MIRVAFDLRDPDRSGIARVARSVARAFVEANSSGRYRIFLAGPVSRLRELGAHQWGGGQATLVEWMAERLSPAAELSWNRVAAASGDAIWYFPHFDVPFSARVRRSIVTIHDLIALHVPGATTRSRRWLSDRWIRTSGRRATRIVCGTQFTREELTERWPDFAGKIRVIPHGLDPEFLAPANPLPPDLAGFAARGPFMLSVGNRKPHKNLAMGAAVLERIPELRWVILGESFRGWDEVAARIRSAGVEDRVLVADPRPDAVLRSLYGAAACLFFPSRHEGFGLPVLEALAAGTPVVAGAAGATVEVLAGHGAVCGLDDADAFVTAVRASMIHRSAASAAGRAYAANFTWGRAAAMLASVLDEVAAVG